jgi:NtrC-family two-component system sensor histidine kinase KinB
MRGRRLDHLLVRGTGAVTDRFVGWTPPWEDPADLIFATLALELDQHNPIALAFLRRYCERFGLDFHRKANNPALDGDADRARGLSSHSPTWPNVENRQPASCKLQANEAIIVRNAMAGGRLNGSCGRTLPLLGRSGQALTTSAADRHGIRYSVRRGTAKVKTLQTKVVIGLLPTLAILMGLGLWAIVMFYRLGGNIDVILRENYTSIVAAEGMKEAIERMDSGLLFAVGGQDKRGREQFEENRPRFEEKLKTEKGNVTVAGEQALVNSVEALFRDYLVHADHFFSLDPQHQTEVYFAELEPTFNKIRVGADGILALNQENMTAMDRRARSNATNSIRLMTVALIAAVVLAVGAALQLSRSILRPIQAVTDSARAMARGELDQLVPAVSRDELGDLANAFNEMARTLREYRQAGTARLLRAQKTAQATIDSFPDPVVVVDPVGSVEQANRSARRLLGVTPAAEPSVVWVPAQPLQSLINHVLAGRGDYLPLSLEQAIPLDDGGQERYYLPRVVAIRTERDELIGAAVALADVTKFHLLDRLKSDMVATVSHELKTPLTSVQMAIHLLLEEVVGPLTTKQVELLLAARQDADRILTMINDLLDLTRIEQGRVRLDLEPLPAADLVDEAVARFQSQAQARGVTLTATVAGHGPMVMVDRDRIEHVFDNLIVNAIQHTNRGGTVHVGWIADGELTRFVVEDNGEGIPAEHVSRLFEKFYRVPTSRHSGGAGLGLAIVREIVTAHGGEISVDSEPGKGARFAFTLPAVGLADASPSLEGANQWAQRSAS